MKIQARGLIQLLTPFARPYLGVLVLVLLLNAAGAFLQQGTYLLLQPTWTVLFGGQDGMGDEDLGIVRGELDGDALGRAAEGDPEVARALERVQAHLPEAKPADPTEVGFVQDLRQRFNRFLIGDAKDISDANRVRLLGAVAAAISVMALLAALAQYFAVMLSTKVSLGMIVEMRQALAEHLMGLSLRYHGGRKFGDLLSRISADVGSALQVVNLFLRDLVQEPLSAIIALSMAAFVAPKAALFLVCALPLLVLPLNTLLKKVRKRSTRSLTELGSSTQVMTQMFSGIRTVKAFRAEGRELQRFRDVNERYTHETMKMASASALSGSWTILYTHVGMGLMVLLVGWLLVAGHFPGDGGDMMTFFFLVSSSYSSIKRTTRALGTVAMSQGACERLQELLDEEPDIVDRPGATVAEGLGSGVRFEGVTFHYPSGDRPAIADLDLHVRPGETLALVGPSGAGKSTLMDLVARFVDPDEGRVTVDGVDLRDRTLDSWTGQYAMVTQTPFLFHTSVLENIRYGRPDATQAEIEAAAKAANIHDFIVGLPEGYETDVADAGSRLSGGQAQRITIARAFLRGAPLILLDEATSALDTQSESVVQEALDRLIEGHTVMVIAHRLSTIRNADRIAVLDEGRLVELGTHAELLELEGLYARLHAMQFREDPD